MVLPARLASRACCPRSRSEAPAGVGTAVAVAGAGRVYEAALDMGALLAEVAATGTVAGLAWLGRRGGYGCSSYWIKAPWGGSAAARQREMRRGREKNQGREEERGAGAPARMQGATGDGLWHLPAPGRVQHAE